MNEGLFKGGLVVPTGSSKRKIPGSGDSPEDTEASLVVDAGAEIAGVQPAATFAAMPQAAESGLDADADTCNFRIAGSASVIDDGQVVVGASSVEPVSDEPSDGTGLVSELSTTGGEKAQASPSAFLPGDQGDAPINSEVSRAAFSLSDDPENPLSQRLSGSVAFGHPADVRVAKRVLMKLDRMLANF